MHCDAEDKKEIEERRLDFNYLYIFDFQSSLCVVLPVLILKFFPIQSSIKCDYAIVNHCI